MDARNLSFCVCAAPGAGKKAEAAETGSPKTVANHRRTSAPAAHEGMIGLHRGRIEILSPDLLSRRLR